MLQQWQLKKLLENSVASAKSLGYNVLEIMYLLLMTI
jgi:hypothetical protein